VCSVLVVGLAVVLALQIAVHLRLAGIPSRAGEHFPFELRRRARADADAVEERAAKSVGEIVKSLHQHHDRIQRYQFELHESYRAERAALKARALEREAQANTFVDLVTVLRTVTSELVALRGDDAQRETREALQRADAGAPLRVPERRPPPVPRAAERAGEHCAAGECFRGLPEVDVCTCNCPTCANATELLLRAQEDGHATSDRA
jgi:hypothetical protein